MINSLLKQVRISEYQDEDNSIITNNYKSDLKEEVNKIFIYYLFAEISKYNQDNLKNNIENSLNILRIFFNYN